VELPDRTIVNIIVRVQPEHAHAGARYARAAAQSLSTLAQWLGPYSGGALTLVDPPWRGGADAGESAIVVDRLPLWTSSVSMAPQPAAARVVGGGRWRAAVDASALPPWFIEGVVEYSARRIVTPMFQGENLGTGFAMLEPRYFGGFVPRFIRIRLMPE